MVARDIHRGEMTSKSLHSRVPVVLLIVAAALCALRFFDLNSAPFINDEPQLQLLLDQHLAAHSFPVIGLWGTHSVRYGPAALWFYYPVRLITDQVNSIIACFAMIIVAGFALMVAGVWKSVGKNTAAWVAAFAASSPYLFFYSRLPWDNTLLIFVVALVCLCVVRLDHKASDLDSALLGVGCGLIFNLHLMALPIFGAVALTLFPAVHRRWNESRELRVRTLKGLVISIVLFACVIFPYLRVVWQTLLKSHQFSPLLPNLGSGLKHTGRYLSWSAMGYFLEGPKDFRDMLFDRPLSMIYRLDPSILLKIAAWAGVLITGWKLLKRKEPVPAIQRMAFFSIVLLMLYYAGLSMDMNQPHYFMPIWWVMIFFAALAIEKSHGKLRALLTVAGVATIGMNIFFVFAAHCWILQNHGTRGIHYTPVHADLESVVGQICADAIQRHPADLPSVSLEAQDVIGIFPFSVEY